MEHHGRNLCAQPQHVHREANNELVELGAVTKETKGQLTGRFTEDSIYPFRR